MNEKRSYLAIFGSLVLAGIVWFSASMNGTFVTSIVVPLTVANLPGDVALAKPLPRTVTVSLKGTGWQLFVLKVSKQLTFELPGTQVHSDRSIVMARYLSLALKLPEGVQALSVYPESLSIELDRFVTKVVPVTTEGLIIRCREGFGLTGPLVIEPDSVVLHGAENVLRRVTSWGLQSREYEDLISPVSDEIALKDSLYGVVKLDLTSIRFHAPIQQIAETEFHNIPVIVNDVPASRLVLLAPSSLTVLVRGGINTLATLSPGDFKAYLEYPTVVADSTGAVTPRIVVPAGCTLLSTSPPQIRFTVRSRE